MLQQVSYIPQEAKGRLKDSEERRLDEDPPKTTTAICFPLHSIMLALNRTKIDYFSLDVEGKELDVLKTIPFDELDISVLSVEYLHVPNYTEIGDFMESKGYILQDTLRASGRNFCADYIFIKKGLLLDEAKAA